MNPVYTAIADSLTAVLITYIEENSGEQVGGPEGSSVPLSAVSYSPNGSTYTLTIADHTAVVTGDSCAPTAEDYLGQSYCEVEVDFTVVIEERGADLFVGKSGGDLAVEIDRTAMNITTGTASNAGGSVTFAPAADSADHVYIPFLFAKIYERGEDSDPTDDKDDSTDIVSVEANTIYEDRSGTQFNDPVELNIPASLTSTDGHTVSATIVAGLTMDLEAFLDDTTTASKDDPIVISVTDVGATFSVDGALSDGDTNEFSIDITDGTADKEGTEIVDITIDGKDIDFGETSTDFLAAGFALDFQSVLSEVNPITLMLDADRTSSDLLEYSNFSLVVAGTKYDISSVTMNNAGEIVAMSASSGTGIEITVSESGGVSTGTVTDNGTKVADIAKKDGVLTASFTDGTDIVL